MPYCTHIDVETEAGGGPQLVALTDLGDTELVDGTVLDQAIGDAEAWIDSYIGRQRAVPLAAPVPRVIRRVAAEETVFVLRSRRHMETERDVEKHLRNERWLEHVAAGRITLGVDPQPAKSGLVAPEVLDFEVHDVEVTPGRLVGFW